MFACGHVQTEWDKFEKSKLVQKFQMMITFEVYHQSLQYSVGLTVVVVRTGYHRQILLITPILRLTPVFVTFTGW